MKIKPRILWLEGVFDENTISAFPASSPAVNLLHAGFVRALGLAGCEVSIIGNPYDRIWPAGRLIVKASDAALASGFNGHVVGYLNVPLLRRQTQSLNYIRQVKAYLAANGRPQYVVTFNDTPGTPAAQYLSRKMGVPWIYFAGDGPAVQGADGYIIQNWAYFASHSTIGPKIHLDGGLPSLEKIGLRSAERMPNSLMYMGALTVHGGVLELARAFHSLDEEDIELWITGRGTNVELERLAAADPRIKLYGFVEREQLHRLASRARIFANPRPTAFAPNKLNYPSKLLHYLAYGRPVLSTFTDGLSPDYHEVLIPIAEENEQALAQSIRDAMLMPDSVYQAWCERVERFSAKRSWGAQVERLLDWLEVEFEQPSRPA